MTDPKTLARTNNPQTSKDAAEKMVKSGALSGQENEVLFTIKVLYKGVYKGNDFTTKDIAKKMFTYPYDKAYDICRKRFSGLRDKGKIERIWLGVSKKTGKNIYKRRDDCCVWRLL